MLKRSIFFSFFLIFGVSLRAQVPDTLEASRLLASAKKLYNSVTGEYKTVFEQARLAKDLFSKALGNDHVRVADSWYWMGTGANYLPNEHSQDYFDRAYQIYQKTIGENHEQTIMARVQYAALFGFAGEHEKCLALLKPCIEKFENNPATPPAFLAFAYNYYGGFANEAGDNESAIAYLNKSIQLNLKVGKGTAVYNAANGYHALGLLYSSEGDFEKALENQFKAFEIFSKKFSLTNSNFIGVLVGLASTYLYASKPDSALYFSRLARENLLKNFGTAHPSLISTNNIDGLAFLAQNQPAAALQSWEKALKIVNAPGNQQFLPLRFSVYLYLAEHFFKEKQYVIAQSWCDSVIIASRFDAARQPSLDGTADWQNLTRALSLKIQILGNWLETGDSPDRRTAFLKAKSDLKTCLREMKNPNSESVFDASMQKKVLLPAAESALDFENFSEKNSTERVSKQFAAAQFAKAEALSIGFQSNRVQHFAGLPDSILQNEKQLKKSLAELRAKVAEAEAKHDSAALQKLYAEQFEKKQNFDRHEKLIEKNYPKFHALRSENRPPTLAEVRQKLLPDGKTALLEYFVGERSIYIFRLTKTAAKSWKIPRPADFDSLVLAFRRAISDHDLLRRDPVISKKLYAETAARVSDLLLSEPLAGLPPEVSRLIIVPDGLLNYVAFEALFYENGADLSKNYRDFPFLIKKYAISYGYSAGLLLEQNAPAASRPTKNFAGFAPKYDSKNVRPDDTLATRSLAFLVRGGGYELPGAQGEVSAISKLLGGEVFQNELATEANFRSRAGDFRVLHLAMHALADDQNPALSRLLFSKNAPDSLFDNQLTSGEIYGLSLPADLAVLTACNSGFGNLRRGEGAMSLARAFTFAGVRSTVMSLWQSPDAQTERLMVIFYENLKQGMAKDEALRQAKIACFSTAENPELGHPFFWAGHVLNGNSQPLDLSNGVFGFWILGGLVVFGLSFLVFWRRRAG